MKFLFVLLIAAFSLSSLSCSHSFEINHKLNGKWICTGGIFLNTIINIRKQDKNYIAEIKYITATMQQNGYEPETILFRLGRQKAGKYQIEFQIPVLNSYGDIVKTTRLKGNLAFNGRELVVSNSGGTEIPELKWERYEK